MLRSRPSDQSAEGRPLHSVGRVLRVARGDLPALRYLDQSIPDPRPPISAPRLAIPAAPIKIPPPLTPLLADHQAALDEFSARASAVPLERWDLSRAPGKWTPAQDTKHLVLGYEAFLRDLRGEGTLQLRGKWWQRRIWRFKALGKILSTGRLLPGARSPRELRPPDSPGDQATLLAELQTRANQFHAMVIETAQANPRRKITHPYLNGLTLTQLVRFDAIHVRHHAAFLPDAR